MGIRQDQRYAGNLLCLLIQNVIMLRLTVDVVFIWRIPWPHTWAIKSAHNNRIVATLIYDHVIISSSGLVFLFFLLKQPMLTLRTTGKDGKKNFLMVPFGFTRC